MSPAAGITRKGLTFLNTSKTCTGTALEPGLRTFHSAYRETPHSIFTRPSLPKYQSRLLTTDLDHWDDFLSLRCGFKRALRYRNSAPQSGPVGYRLPPDRQACPSIRSERLPDLPASF